MSEAVEEKSKRRRRRRNRDAEEENNEETTDRGITAPKGRATRGRRTGKDSDHGGNFITKSIRGTREYFRGVQDELDKVVWPTREELIRLTRIVLIVTIASAITLGIISFIFTELFVIGLRDDNPIIFVAFFVVAGLGYFVISRMLREGDQSPY